MISSTIVKFTDNALRLWRATVNDNARVSLLSRNESNALKGFLIILVVLGHNKFVMKGGMSNVFLYSFHVYAFYYLPFLYDFKRIEWKNFFRQNLTRLYVPYTIFFGLVTLVAFTTGTSLPPIKVVVAYICGSQNMLHTTFGFGSFLWFLPTMLSVLMFRQIYYRSRFVWRNILLILSGICWLGFAYMFGWYIPVWWYTPFCLTVGLGMVLPAVLLRSVITQVKQPAIVLCFFLLMVAIMIFYPVAHKYSYTYLTINRLLCSILIFSLLLTISRYLAGSKLLINLGVQSLVIYLTHQFIYNGCYRIMHRHDVGIYEGLIMFVIALAGGYLLSQFKPIRYVFPR